MYPIISEVHTEYKDIRYRTKNDCGQILNLTFYLEEYNSGDEWYIELWMGKRSKGFQWMTQTGKDGIKSLLWAKECLRDFIKNLDRSKINKIIVYWDDNRRRDVYAKGLKDIGFEYKATYKSRKGLVLTINKEL